MAFNPTIPEITKAYENDPRTKIAMTLMGSGMNTASTATGKWAWADGIARALSGVSGAYINKQQQKKFKEREDKYMADFGNAVMPQQPAIPGMGSGIVATPEQQAMTAQLEAQFPGMDAKDGPVPPQQPPSFAPQSLPEMRQGMVGSNGPLQQVDPNAFIPAPLTGQGAPQMAPGSLTPPPAQMAPSSGPMAAPAMPPVAPAMVATSIPSAVPVQKPKPQGHMEPFKGFTSAKPSSTMGARRSGGSSHNGEDFPMPIGTPIMAPAGGAVRIKENKRGGKQAILTMADGSRFGVAHLNGWNVKDGARVEAGTVIGMSGNTGKSTGPHGHFTWTDPKRGKISIREGLANAMPATATDAAAPDAVPQPPVQMEDMPTLDPAVAMPSKPVAPELPKAVQSERLAIAKRLLASGNPDLMAMAQNWMENGLSDQNTNNLQANQQHFAQSQTGYQSELGDYTGARSDARSDFYGTRRDVANRNFQREDREDTQAWQSGENAASRDHDTAMAQFGRETQVELQNMQNNQQWKMQERQIDATAGTAEEKRAAKAAAFYNTPTGAKIFDKMQGDLQSYNNSLVDLDRLSQLTEKVKSGGLLGIPWMDSAIGTANPDVGEFNALTTKYTLDKIGGSLGAQISNSDRDFILREAPSVKLPAETNRRLIQARKAVVERNVEYQNELLQAIPEGRQASFVADWQKYINAVSIKKNISFAEWRASRPKFDANGNKVQ